MIRNVFLICRHNSSTFLKCLVLGVLVFSSSLAFSQFNPKSFDGTDQYAKNYLEHLPDDYNASDPTRYPVIISLHGFGEGGTNLSQLTGTGIPALIQNGKFPASFTVSGKVYKFIVIAPQLNQGGISWYTPQVDYVMKQIKILYKNKADFQRIYLTGYSGGGAGVYTYPASSINSGKQLAAVVPCTGAAWYQSSTDISNIVSAGLPVWAFHNDGDPTVPLSSDYGWYSALNAAGINPAAKLTIYPNQNSHDCWTRTYDTSPTNPNNIYTWMLGYSRPNILNPGSPAPSVATSRAGSSQTITLPVNSVILDGTGSTDAGSTLTSYLWTKVSGPAGDNLTNSSLSKAGVSFTNAGTYVYSLTVKDLQGNSNTSQTSIQVNALLAGPSVATARTGANQTITIPATATLDASSSTDAGSTLTTYAWTKVSGPSGDVLTNAGLVKASVSFTVAGTYVYSLTVTDLQGHSATAQTSILVNVFTVPLSVPTANAGPNQTITLPTFAVTLAGYYSKDLGSTISSYLWAKVSGPAGDKLYNTTTNQAGVNFTTAGTYVYSLTITDLLGQSNTAQTTVVVNPLVAAVPPVIIPVANAGTPQSVQLPVSTVSLNGSQSMVTGVIGAVYSWSEISGPSTVNLNSSTDINPTVSNLVAGTYVFNLKIMNSAGNSSFSTVTITVTSSIAAQSSASIFPNPVKSTATFSFSSPLTGVFNTELFDQNGNSMYKVQLQKPALVFSQLFDMSSVPSGMYILKITMGSYTTSLNLIKQ